MKILITGGAGFIGSNLTDRLIEAGHTVWIIDNLHGGRRDFFTHHSSSSRKGKFRFIKLDIRDTGRLKAVISKDIHLVFHLAANADISLGVEDPTLDFEHSIVATFSLLQAMRHHGLKRIFYTSGSGIYGDQGLKFSRESFGPLEPVSMYGASKLGAEALISAFCHLFDMHAWIVRPANIIGPRATHGVVFDFVKRLKQNPTELRILGDGKQSKAYLHVDDVIDAFFFVLKDNQDRVNFYNLSSNSFITVNKIAEVVLKTMKLNQTKILRSKSPFGWQGDVPIVRISSGKIRKLGWRPRLNSAQAVRATVLALLEDPRFYTSNK